MGAYPVTLFIEADASILRPIDFLTLSIHRRHSRQCPLSQMRTEPHSVMSVPSRSSGSEQFRPMGMYSLDAPAAMARMMTTSPLMFERKFFRQRAT